MSGLPKMVKRSGESLSSKPELCFNLTAMCPEASALSFHRKLQSKEKQESRLFIFLLL